ncbi:MCE family protein [Mycobacterium sp.]|uniref:MCE family protein n=1 Tax=Mycobacterium sp. TaxID=1785 RepID=UPI003D0B0584
MKSFQERNTLVIGLIGIFAVAVLLVTALNYTRLPFVSRDKAYQAYFAELGGLRTGSPVEVSGFEVGAVADVKLERGQVLVKFTVADNVRLGERTEAAIKTKSLLGAKILDISPRGYGTQTGPIPIERTTSPYQLPDALGDLSATISGLNTNQLSDSLSTLANTFKDTPPDLKVAVEGVARFSQTLDARDAELRKLLSNAKKATGVLSQRSDEVVTLIADTDALLLQLRSQSTALGQISNNVSAVTRQLKGFIDENKQTLRPALDKLNGVLTIVDNRKEAVQQAIKGVNIYAMSLGESVSSGPFFKAYLANLLPGQFVQPFVDAAFSDLGLDPHVLLPSDRSDPQIGQPGTPPLPLPYPRTGQGGPPKRTLPDAITGNPGDQPCSVPGRPGAPGCYPYREPLPAPPPGGPPPGPPAPIPPELRGSTPQQTPRGILVPAPNEVPATQTAPNQAGR